MRVYDRLDDDGDRGWILRVALHAVLNGRLVQRDEHDDGCWIYRLTGLLARPTPTRAEPLEEALRTHNEGNEASLDKDASSEPERVHVKVVPI